MLYFDNNSTRASLTFLRPPRPLLSAHVTPCPARETKIRKMLQHRERGGTEGRHQGKGSRRRAEQNRMGQAGGLMGWRMNADEQKHCSVASLRSSGQTCHEINTKKLKINNLEYRHNRTGWVEIWLDRLHLDLDRINFVASDSSRCLKSLVTITVMVKLRCKMQLLLKQAYQVVHSSGVGAAFRDRL